eukprot:6085175-Alexandrium_andersonii.AAC.1
MPPVRTSPSVAPAPSSPLLVGHGCSQGGYRIGSGRARAVLLQWDKELKASDDGGLVFPGRLRGKASDAESLGATVCVSSRSLGMGHE